MDDRRGDRYGAYGDGLAKRRLRLQLRRQSRSALALGDKYVIVQEVSVVFAVGRCLRHLSIRNYRLNG